MAIILSRGGASKFEGANVEFNHSKNHFTVFDKNSSDKLIFSYPLKPDYINKRRENQFEIFLFHKDRFATNDIFQVKIADHRLGWLFPLQALISSQHDFAENPHFFTYSYNAYKILLKNKRNIPYQDILYDEQPNLEDLYGENTIIFMIYKDNIKTLKSTHNIDFIIDDFLCFFYQYGYTLLNQNNFLNLINIKLPNANHKKMAGGSFNLSPLSRALLTDKSYINSLIQGLVKLEKHPLVKFHLLYSVIELYISKIFEVNFKASAAALLNSSDFYEAKEVLIKMTNEKERINKLFSDRTPGIDQQLLDLLQLSCNDFLNFVFAPETFEKGSGEALYKVRSLIFHNLRTVPEGYEILFEKIILNLEGLILDIAIKFLP